jgi:hypothetical protein
MVGTDVEPFAGLIEGDGELHEEVQSPEKWRPSQFQELRIDLEPLSRKLQLKECVWPSPRGESVFPTPERLSLTCATPA